MNRHRKQNNCLGPLNMLLEMNEALGPDELVLVETNGILVPLPIFEDYAVGGVLQPVLVADCPGWRRCEWTRKIQ